MQTLIKPPKYDAREIVGLLQETKAALFRKNNNSTAFTAYERHAMCLLPSIVQNGNSATWLMDTLWQRVAILVQPVENQMGSTQLVLFKDREVQHNITLAEAEAEVDKLIQQMSKSI